MRAYARQSQNTQLEADAFEVRKRAERRLGELMAEQKKTEGFSKGAAGKPGPGRGKRGSKMDPRFNDPPTLKDAGINKHLADRARKFASMPERAFQEALRQGRDQILNRKTDPVMKAHRDAERERRLQEDRAAAEKVDASYEIYHVGIDDVTPEMLADCSVHGGALESRRAPMVD
jgi:hypothetical protein